MGSVLVLSKGTEGAPIAHRLGVEGAITKLFFDNQQYNNVLLGSKNPIVIPHLRMLEQYDIILDTGTSSSDLVVSEGYTILGGSPFGRRISEDQTYQDRVLKLCGRKLKDATPAISLIFTTGWFNGLKFEFFTYSISYERLCEGHKGSPQNAMGRVTHKAVEGKEFEGLIPLLQKIKYLGPISLGDGWISTTIFPIEVFELYKGKSFDLLWALKNQQQIILRDDYAIMYKLINTSPNSEKVLLVEKEAFPHVCYQDLQDDGKPSLSGSTMCLVTARSQQLFEARRRAMRTIRRIIQTPDIQFRNDIGCDIEDKLRTLEAQNNVAEEAVCASN